MSLKNIFGGVGLAMILAACSSTEIKKSENPEEIFKEGQSLLNKDRFLEANEYFNEIRHRFPQSRFAALAELRLADIEFKQDNFTEAAAAYGVFLELFPNNSEAAYALFQKAQSYFSDAPENVARDQSTAQSAVEAAEQLEKRYPDSEYAVKAKVLHEKSRLRLAQKEAYVARFYEKRKAPLAALRRWEGLKSSFSDLENLKDLPEGPALYAEASKKIALLTPLAEKPE